MNDPKAQLLTLMAKTIADQARREAMADICEIVAKARANRIRREAEHGK